MLSRVLPQRPARLANLGAVAITAAFVIFGGSVSLHYAFFVAMELVAMLLIARYAWTWPAGPEAHSLGQASSAAASTPVRA